MLSKACMAPGLPLVYELPVESGTGGRHMRAWAWQDEARGGASPIGPPACLRWQ